MYYGEDTSVCAPYPQLANVAAVTSHLRTARRCPHSLIITADSGCNIVVSNLLGRLGSMEEGEANKEGGRCRPPSQARS